LSFLELGRSMIDNKFYSEAGLNDAPMRAVLFSALLVAVVLAPSAAAHAAPLPPEWMKRMLHDFTDDWGSDASAGSPRDGHDLVALDLREEYNRTLGAEALAIRLSMNFGFDQDGTKPELREVVTFKAKGATVTREFKTPDNSKFTGTFDAVTGPFPILKSDGTPDGKRFYVEGTLKFSTLGVAVGDKVSDFFVQGYGGSDKADFMVGGYYLNGARVDAMPPGEDYSYNAGSYTLRGPVMYAKSTLDKSSLTLRPGDNKTLTWSITNNLGRAQIFTITTQSPEGVSIGLHGAKFAMDTLSFDVQAGTTATVHVYVLPGTGATSGDLDLTLSTSLGGRMTHHVALTISGAAASSPASSEGAPSTEHADSPGFAGYYLLLVTAACAVALRKRGR
jgi:hypothetical protein